MALLIPTPVLKVAWASAPLAASPSYTTITSASGLRRTQISRGRTYETDDFRAGTMTLICQNLMRNWEPGYSSGAWYPNVDVRKRVDLGCSYSVGGGGTPALFNGFIDDITGDWPNMVDDEVAIVCTDAFSILSSPISGTFAAVALDGERIEDLLDAVSWPAGAANRNIDPGLNALQAQVLRGRSALEAIKHAELSAWGRFYADAAGVLQYVNRRTTYENTTIDATFDDTGANRSFRDLKFSYSRARVKNRFTGNIVGGDEQEVSDSTSITAYGEATEPIPETLLTTANENLDLLNYRLSRQKNPAVRIDPMKCMIHTGAFAAVDPLNYDIGSRFYLSAVPPGGGTARTATVDVEGIDDDINWAAGTWERTFHLAIADPNTYWHLGTVGLGELDQTARPGF